MWRAEKQPASYNRYNLLNSSAGKEKKWVHRPKKNKKIKKLSPRLPSLAQAKADL